MFNNNVRGILSCATVNWIHLRIFPFYTEKGASNLTELPTFWKHLTKWGKKKQSPNSLTKQKASFFTGKNEAEKTQGYGTRTRPFPPARINLKKNGGKNAKRMIRGNNRDRKRE